MYREFLPLPCFDDRDLKEAQRERRYSYREFLDPKPRHETNGGDPDIAFGNGKRGQPLKVMIRGTDPKADMILDVLENGIFDALRKNILEAIQLTILVDKDAPQNVLESYTFSFKYAKGSRNVDHCLESLSIDPVGYVADMRSAQSARIEYTDEVSRADDIGFVEEPSDLRRIEAGNGVDSDDHLALDRSLTYHDDSSFQETTQDIADRRKLQNMMQTQASSSYSDSDLIPTQPINPDVAIEDEYDSTTQLDSKWFLPEERITKIREHLRLQKQTLDLPRSESQSQGLVRCQCGWNGEETEMYALTSPDGPNNLDPNSISKELDPLDAPTIAGNTPFDGLGQKTHNSTGGLQDLPVKSPDHKRKPLPDSDKNESYESDDLDKNDRAAEEQLHNSFLTDESMSSKARVPSQRTSDSQGPRRSGRKRRKISNYSKLIDVGAETSDHESI
ncbi:hypothetical protein APSETT445_001837 [Aspergillus pseudonomiae]